MRDAQVTAFHHSVRTVHDESEEDVQLDGGRALPVRTADDAEGLQLHHTSERNGDNELRVRVGEDEL